MISPRWRKLILKFMNLCFRAMENKKPKIIRMSNIPLSLNIFCKDLLKELSKDYEVVVLSSPGEEMEQIRQREKVRCIEVPIERRMSIFKDLKTLRLLIKVFREEKPDMVHTMNPKAGLLGMIAAKRAGVPIRVHSFTGLVFPTAKGLKRFILKTTDRITCRCATHILPEGNGVRRDLVQNSITSKTLRVLGYGNIRGVDMSWYNPESSDLKQRAKAFEDKSCFTFVFVGRLAKDKGIEELIDSFVALQKTNSNIRLILVSWLEEDDAPSARILKEIETNNSIMQTGFVNDVRPYLLASDCLVLPSYREGFPNSPIEAGAMGKPCIVTDINGANEIISNGVNGLIVPPADRESLFEAMSKIASDKALCSRLAAFARQMVADRYDRSIVWDSLKEFYKETLQER